MFSLLEPQLLGFDAREMWPVPWSANRKEVYSLRKDAENIFSVDTSVWPSVFDSVPGSRRPEYLQIAEEFWTDLGQMLQCLQDQPSLSRSCCLVGVTICDITSNRSDWRRWEAWLGRVTPSQIPNDWNLLGYDVADESFISGLSNCGYTDDADRIHELRRIWAPHLNQFHLIDDIEHAATFRVRTDARVTEHAPFFVFGVWRRDWRK